MKHVPVSRGNLAIVDDCDLELVTKHSWSINSGYAYCNYKQKSLAMHRLIMGAKQGQYIDHINGNRLDNRRANLRFATYQQNLCNRGPQKGRKYKGVYTDKRDKGEKYYVLLTAFGKRVYGGCFNNAVDAAKAYDTLAVKLFGSFAKTNF